MSADRDIAAEKVGGLVWKPLDNNPLVWRHSIYTKTDFGHFLTKLSIDEVQISLVDQIEKSH